MSRIPIESKIPVQMKIGRKVRLNFTHCPACKAKPLKKTTKSPLRANTQNTDNNFFLEKVNTKDRLKMKEKT